MIHFFLNAHFEDLLEPDMFAEATCGGCLVVWPLGNHFCQLKMSKQNMKSICNRVVSHYAVIMFILDVICSITPLLRNGCKDVQGLSILRTLFQDPPDDLMSSWCGGLEPRKHLTLQRQRCGRGLEGLGMRLGPLSSLLLCLRAW